MTIKRLVYEVAYLNDDDVEIETQVRVTMGDQIDAEIYGPQVGLVDPLNQSHQIGALWLWFAMRRSGLIADAVEFEQFKRRLLDTAKVDGGDVPPTETATRDGSPSASL